MRKEFFLLNNDMHYVGKMTVYVFHGSWMTTLLFGHAKFIHEPWKTWKLVTLTYQPTYRYPRVNGQLLIFSQITKRFSSLIWLVLRKNWINWYNNCLMIMIKLFKKNQTIKHTDALWKIMMFLWLTEWNYKQIRIIDRVKSTLKYWVKENS
jgi:hypothetical protein